MSVKLEQAPRVIALTMAIVVGVSGCAAMAHRSFVETYIDPMIGVPADVVYRAFPYPIEVRDTDGGTKIYTIGYPAFRPTDCQVHYEIRDEIIVSATHTGDRCKRYDVFF